MLVTEYISLAFSAGGSYTSVHTINFSRTFAIAKLPGLWIHTAAYFMNY